MFSPYTFPVSAATFNFASPVFVGVTILGVVSWWFTPEDRWLSREFIAQARAGIQVASDEDLTGEKGEGSPSASTTTAETAARA